MEYYCYYHFVINCDNFRFNLQVEIKLMQRIVENGFVNARSGELFACVPLTDHLNEDTDAGKKSLLHTFMNWLLL